MSRAGPGVHPFVAVSVAKGGGRAESEMPSSSCALDSGLLSSLLPTHHFSLLLLCVSGLDSGSVPFHNTLLRSLLPSVDFGFPEQELNGGIRHNVA